MVNSGLNSGNQTLDYTYDDRGNITTITDYSDNARWNVYIKPGVVDWWNAGTVSYKYNDNGIRTSKTVNGVTTVYYLNGSNVIREYNATDAIDYFYDEKGDLFGFKLKNYTYMSGADFYYIRNGQNDIIGILDNSGNKVVNYVYDSWGKLVSVTGSLAGTVGAINPYRYRGYRYDNETGLYYLIQVILLAFICIFRYMTKSYMIMLIQNLYLNKEEYDEAFKKYMYFCYINMHDILQLRFQ